MLLWKLGTSWSGLEEELSCVPKFDPSWLRQDEGRHLLPQQAQQHRTNGGKRSFPCLIVIPINPQMAWHAACAPGAPHQLDRAVFRGLGRPSRRCCAAPHPPWEGGSPAGKVYLVGAGPGPADLLTASPACRTALCLTASASNPPCACWPAGTGHAAAAAGGGGGLR